MLLTEISYISDLQNSQTLKRYLYVLFCYHKFFVCIKLRYLGNMLFSRQKNAFVDSY